MQKLKSKSVSKPVILLKILNDGTLLAVDSETTMRFFNKETLELQSGFKVGIEHKYHKNAVVAYSDDGNFFATLTADARESRLYDAKSKKLVDKVDRHHGEASCVGIDPLSRYMFSCGDDGKSFAIDTKSGKLVFTLPVHVDTVTDIAFSKNSNWVATASYDRKISLFNLVTMMPKSKLKAHAAPVIKIQFFHKNKLISVDKNATVIIWDIYKAKVIERLQGVHDEVTHMTISLDEQFLFLGTALGYIIVYDLQTYEQISRNYIKISSPISSLAFNGEKNHLIIGTEDGFLMLYNIYEGENIIKTLLQNKEYDAIEKELEKNPLLAYTEIYKLVSNLWEITLKKAKLYLQNGEQDKAIRIFTLFKDIPSKNRVMQKVIRDYAEFDKFTQFAKEGKLALAYGLTNTFPEYKESKIYKSLEARWKKAFTQAQKYALSPKEAQKAKEILAPYRGISDKTKLIQDLLTKGEVYKRFRIALAQKDFPICFELLKQHPFLAEFPEYETLMKYADTLYIKAQKLLEEEDTHSAIKMLRILLDFIDFKDEAKELILQVELKQKFFNAIEENDIASAYNMMALSEDLQETQDGQLLQREWNKDLAKANSYAVDGNINDLKTVLTKYMNISSKYAALATIFGWAYMVQLEYAVKRGEERVKIETGIKNYILNFGVQDQIENFFYYFKKRYPQTKLNFELLSKGSLTQWRPSMITDSILE
ncbi:WD40 repeat domain-containing protein [Sulfurimonas sp.]